MDHFPIRGLVEAGDLIESDEVRVKFVGVRGERLTVIQSAKPGSSWIFRGTPKVVSWDYLEGLLHGGARIVPAKDEVRSFPS